MYACVIDEPLNYVTRQLIRNWVKERGFGSSIDSPSPSEGGVPTDAGRELCSGRERSVTKECTR